MILGKRLLSLSLAVLQVVQPSRLNNLQHRRRGPLGEGYPALPRAPQPSLSQAGLSRLGPVDGAGSPPRVHYRRRLVGQGLVRPFVVVEAKVALQPFV